MHDLEIVYRDCHSKQDKVEKKKKKNKKKKNKKKRIK